MNFHDFLTIALYGAMILTNAIKFGALVSFLHNASDIPTTITRALSQTKYKNGTIITFIINMVVWIVTRLYLFPVLVFGSWTYGTYPLELSQYQPALYIMNLFLTALIGLHFYWLLLFMNILYVNIKNGSTENTQS